MITSIHQFKNLYPNMVEFDNLIKVRSVDDLEYEYVALDKRVGYWITESPFYDNGFSMFKHFVHQNPVWKSNNEDGLEDPNPMATIHLPPWSAKKLIHLVKDFYCKNLNLSDSFIEEKHEEWGNIYDSSIVRPLDCWRLPHIDYQAGMIGNLWFTEHSKEETGTVLYHYTGKFYGNYYDFHVDTDHPLHDEWNEWDKYQRTDGWRNLSDDELEKWGFIKLGIAPTNYGGMTLYKSNTPHSVYISESCKFRWSHSFAFSHKPVLKNLDIFNLEGMLL